jgi:hypothetical protein
MVEQFPRGVARLLTSLMLGWLKTLCDPSSDPEHHGSKNKNQDRNSNRRFNQSHEKLNTNIISIAM